MKKYCLILGLLLFVNAAQTQVLISILLGDKLNSGKVEFGLEGGFNWSTIKNLEKAKSLRTFNLGFYFDIKLKNPSWMVNTGVIVKSAMGADELPVYSIGNQDLDKAFAGGKVKRKINYFNVPILIKYRFKNNIYLKAGTQLGLRYKAFDEFSNSIQDDEDLNYKLKIKDKFHSIDAGLAIGAGYRMMKGNGMNIGVQYYYGLVNIVKDPALSKQYNRVFYLRAGIPIGKNPKKKKTDQSEK
jgi:hypothetical protein